MNITALDHTVIFSQEHETIGAFIQEFKKTYATYLKCNIILHLLVQKNLDPAVINTLNTCSNTHKATGKSFVVVTNMLSYSQVPETLDVVPTLQEAKDVIEMEDIQRDLGL